MSEQKRKAFKILIVDDNPKNIQVVGNLLSREGFPTAFALNGRQALEMVRDAAETDPFDLILLDVMMPEMDGFAVCDALKQAEATREIPVIFLTAKADTESIVSGFELGAYDYVAKPFVSAELLARVRTQLYIKSLGDDLKRRYEEIRQLEGMKDTLMNMIVHDLKNPLGGISGFAQLLLMDNAVSSDPALASYSGSIIHTAQTMLDMIMAILDVARLESGEMQPEKEIVDVREVLREVVDATRVQFKNASVHLKIDLSRTVKNIRGDRELFRRIIVNLVSNALHFAPDGTPVSFSAAPEGNFIRFEITDEGPGIPADYQARIFDKFKQTSDGSQKKYSTGLGLTFCKMAVEAMDGDIGVESQVGNGSVFRFRLPSADGERQKKQGK